MTIQFQIGGIWVAADKPIYPRGPDRRVLTMLRYPERRQGGDRRSTPTQGAHHVRH